MKYNYQNLSSCHTETQFTFRKVSLLLWSANLLSSSLTKALSTLTNMTIFSFDQGDHGDQCQQGDHGNQCLQHLFQFVLHLGKTRHLHCWPSTLFRPSKICRGSLFQKMLRKSKRNSIPPYTYCFSLSCLKSNIRLIIFSNLTTEPLVHTETEWHETALCCSLLPVLRSRSTSGNTGIRYCWIGCHENRRVNRLTLSDAQVFTLCNCGQSSDLVLIGRGGRLPNPNWLSKTQHWHWL